MRNTSDVDVPGFAYLCTGTCASHSSGDMELFEDLFVLKGNRLSPLVRRALWLGEEYIIE